MFLSQIKQIQVIFNHLRLCLATAIHNLKRLRIKINWSVNPYLE